MATSQPHLPIAPITIEAKDVLYEIDLREAPLRVWQTASLRAAGARRNRHRDTCSSLGDPDPPTIAIR